MIRVADLRQGVDLDEQSLASSIALLALAADRVDGAESGLCVDRLKALRAQGCSAVLTDVLDWWLLVRFAIRSSGAAYQLTERLPAPLRDALEELRDRHQRPEVPTLVGVRHRREFAAALSDFRACLTHENAKAGVQAAVRSELADHYEPVLARLEAGELPTSPNLVVADIRNIMRDASMRPGSDLWRKTEREWQELDERCETALRLAAMPAHAYDEADFETLEIDLGWSGPAEVALRVLLRDLVQSRVDDSALVTTLLAGAEMVDAEDAGWMALAVEHFAATHAGACKPLEGELARIRKVRQRINQLAKLGSDVDLALVHLSDGALSEAELLVEERNERRVNEDRKRTLRNKISELRGLAGSVADESILDEIEYAAADVDDERLDEAARRVEGIGSNLRSEMAIQRQVRFEDLRTQLQELGAVGGGEVERLIERAGGDALELTDEDIAYLEDLVDQGREDVRARVGAVIRRVGEQLERDWALVEESARQDIQGLLAQAEEALKFDQYAAAEGPARQAVTLLERSVESLWTADIGEASLVGHVRAYVRTRMQFSVTDVDRLFVGLKTKPFVILSGLTGSGKTTIARLFAESVGATPGNGRFVRVAVRPNWVDEAEVLGYVNPMSNRFEPGWMAVLARECRRQPDLPFFCLLDEMNLAPVEYYLADYLSAIEDANSGSESTTMVLYPSGASPVNANDWQPTIPLPDNLFLIGTVNVDESTRPLSDRVLDRANVIQLSTAIGDRHHDDASGDEDEPRWKVRMRDWRAICAAKPYDGHHDFLVEVAGVLNDELRLGLGIRAHIEMERFLANGSGILDDKDALDVALLQRVIPKVRGFKRDLLPGLQRLLDLLTGVGADRCAAVIEDWLSDSMSDEGFLDGSHARVGLVTSRLA